MIIIESESGNKYAQYKLGLYYQNGWEIEKDETEAFKWFEKAAKQDHSDAQNYLGFFCEKGIGKQKNLKASFYWYLKSAKNGNKFAQHNLSLYFKTIEEIEEDKIKSFELYSILAQLDDNDAQTFLGFLYKNGLGTQKDLKKSFYWYQKSAENGNELAKYNLGNFYRYGWGIVEKNENEALKWYKELAGQQNKLSIKNNELIGETAEIQTSTHIEDDEKFFNCIELKNNTLNRISDNYASEFISVSATICPGISTVSYIEIKKLQNLLISRKDDINHILKSQPVYAIGIDFQKDSTEPCISCWVAKPLDIPVLECLETMFENQFEVMYQIVKPVNENNENNNQIPYESSKSSIDNKIRISSTAGVKVLDQKNQNIHQKFNISANFWAKTAPFKNENSLHYKIEVLGCGVGNMLSNQWKGLKKLGSGYVLHSLKVHVSSVPDNTFMLKEGSHPKQPNQAFEVSKSHEKNINAQSGGAGFGVKSIHNTKFSLNKWNLIYEGPVDGDCWTYEYADNDFDKNINSRKCYIPDETHSGEWVIFKDMSEFQVTFTQILCCELTYGWRRFLPHTGPELLRFYPKINHSLKVTFKDIKNFNENFASLTKECHYNNKLIEIAVGNNLMKLSENPYIQNSGMIDRKLHRI
ncbi:15562_t:CDS:2 [Funneliformis geosporum]|nr:15562_t:CDS:2 [Funneliformis geosporum]